MDINTQELQKAYRLSVIIAIAMIVSLVCYAAIVEILKRNPPASGPAAIPESVIYVFFIVAIVIFFIIPLLKKKILSLKFAPQTQMLKAEPFSPPVQRLLTVSIIIEALCVSVAVDGLVIFILLRNTTYFYTFLLMSFCFLCLYFPRYSQWEAWMKKLQTDQLQGTDLGF